MIYEVRNVRYYIYFYHIKTLIFWNDGKDQLEGVLKNHTLFSTLYVL